MRLLTGGEKTRLFGKAGSNRCKRFRQRVQGSLSRGFSPESPWVQRHVANCPRCQKRLSALGKVDLALRIIKSQPHRLDLLMRANSRAVKMLNHQLRDEAQVRQLDKSKPEPVWIERCRRYQNVAINVAACLAILLLTKAGLFTSFAKARTEGQEAMKQYYADRAGEDVASEVFEI